MRYLINRKTKEHKAFNEKGTIPEPYADWVLIQADSEGWIPHTGTECPLPDDVRCEAKISDGFPNTNAIARYCEWGRIGVHSITHYRPILTEKVQEPEPYVDDGTRPEPPPADYRDDLVSRLKAAHEAAQTIPDLEAELREVLGSMGYRLDKLSPFVEPEQAIETPQDNKYAAEW